MIAKSLVKGDKIGVEAPSGSYKEKYRDNFERATKLLESMGYELVFAKNLFETSKELSVDAQKRADDINEMFKNKDIKAIISLDYSLLTHNLIKEVQN